MFSDCVFFFRMQNEWKLWVCVSRFLCFSWLCLDKNTFDLLSQHPSINNCRHLENAAADE